MADGNGTKLAARASNEEGAYMFNMNDSSASSHTLDMGDSGKIYMLYSTVVRTITLPAVAAGLKFKFIATDTTADSSIATSEGTALLKGGAEAGNSYLTLAGTTIIVEAAASFMLNIYAPSSWLALAANLVPLPSAIIYLLTTKWCCASCIGTIHTTPYSPTVTITSSNMYSRA